MLLGLVRSMWVVVSGPVMMRRVMVRVVLVSVRVICGPSFWCGFLVSLMVVGGFVCWVSSSFQIVCRCQGWRVGFCWRMWSRMVCSIMFVVV